ncbi:MAG: phage holin family protein [Erythrobacter sp.]
MLDDDIGTRSTGDEPSEPPAPDVPSATEDGGNPPAFAESIVEEVSALIEDAGLYATAEIAFQKTRAKVAGRTIGAALAFVVLAIILLHIALIAMAVGFVIALEPLVTIWGAIAIVFGVLLLSVGLLIYSAVKRGKLLAEIFGSSSETTDDKSDEA